MPRRFDKVEFNRAYDELIVGGRFQEVPAYYPRYRSRYRYLVKRFAEAVGPPPVDVLDIGGGQLALLVHALWGDRATAADLPGPHFDYLKERGVATTTWNLCSEEQPFTAAFDAVFFSEVIEHLPIPGHIVLERIRRAMRPGGVIVCSTPNLYRLRNIVYLAIGKRIFDVFTYPEDRGLGHVLEYSREHLQWQFEKAGFVDCAIELVELRHWPNNWAFKVMSAVGYPLTWYPRFRGNLVATGWTPA